MAAVVTDSKMQLLGQCAAALPHYRAYAALPENPRITQTNRDEAHQRTQATCSRSRLVRTTSIFKLAPIRSVETRSAMPDKS